MAASKSVATSLPDNYPEAKHYVRTFPRDTDPAVLARSHARTTKVQCQTEDPRASCPKMRRLRWQPHRGHQANGGCTHAESLLLACSPTDVAGLQWDPPWGPSDDDTSVWAIRERVIGERGRREKAHTRTQRGTSPVGQAPFSSRAGAGPSLSWKNETAFHRCKGRHKRESSQ